MMKILVVSQYFYPEQFRINDVCFELVRRGHTVTVLTGLPNYPEGKIFPGYENKGNTVETINGVMVVRCKLRPRNKGTKNLVLNYFSFVKQANKHIKYLDKDFDIVYVYGVSPITQAIPAIKYKKKRHVSVFYYVSDIWPECVRGKQNGHKQLGLHNPIYIFAKLLTKWVYRKIDLLINKCDEFVDYNSRVCKVSISKQRVLFEHAENVYLKVSEMPRDNGIIDFMFLGNLGKVQNCDLIIRAVSRLKETNPYMVHFVGDGSELQFLKQLVLKLRLSEKIVFHNKCSIDETIDYYNLADVCLLTLSHKTESGLTLVGKLPGYLAACRPVIGSIDGASKTVIEESKSGFVCPADDLDGLTVLMQKVIDNPSLLNGCGNNGRDFFNSHFTLNSFINSLELILSNYLKGKRIEQ